MSSKDSSGKTVRVAQDKTTSESEIESERGAIYGEASEERAVRMHERDVVQYPSAEVETEYDLSIDGVPGDEIGQKRAEQGRLDRGTDEAVDGSWGGPGGESEFDNKTLYTQERIEAREEEIKQISIRAGTDQDVHILTEKKTERQELSMEVHQTRMEECREEVAAQSREGIVGRGYVDDPREHLANETVGEIFKHSKRVAEKYGQERRVVAKRIAEKVADGADVNQAVMNLVEELCEDRTVVSPMEMVDPSDSWGTVEGVVTRSFDPSTTNQQQVVIIEDETDSAKLTIWRNSNQGVRLNEGDVVRVIDGKPGGYNGRLTFAATSDTQIWRREKGDEPSPMGGVEISESSVISGEIADEDDTHILPKTDFREIWQFPAAEDMPEVDGISMERTSFEGSEERSNITRGEAKDSGLVGFVAIADRQSDTYGVTWGDQVRQEFEKRGREQRIAERKYNISEWERETSRIDHYEHTSISEFGADDRMVHLDLPALSNDE